MADLGPQNSKDILIRVAKAIVGLQDFFEEFELLHANLTGLDHTLESPEEAVSFFKSITEADLEIIPDEFPLFRRTYLKDLISSMIAQCRYFTRQGKGGGNIRQKVEALFSVCLPDPINLDLEWERVPRDGAFVKNGAEGLVTPLIMLKDQSERYPFSLKVQKRLEKIFGPLPFWHKMNVSQILPDETTPACFYSYKGGYQGVFGHEKSLKEGLSPHLSAFLFHETVPGHHFYYCLREYSWRKGKSDLIQTIDPFYSPETLVNEGIATSVDLLFPGLLSGEVERLFARDRFCFLALYNAWYLAHVEGSGDYRKPLELMAERLEISSEKVERLEQIFLNDLRLYFPAYPVGILLIRSLVQRLSGRDLRYIWYQHSDRTLRKLMKIIH